MCGLGVPASYRQSGPNLLPLVLLPVQNTNRQTAGCARHEECTKGCTCVFAFLMSLSLPPTQFSPTASAGALGCPAVHAVKLGADGLSVQAVTAGTPHAAVHFVHVTADAHAEAAADCHPALQHHEERPHAEPDEHAEHLVHMAADAHAEAAVHAEVAGHAVPAGHAEPAVPADCCAQCFQLLSGQYPLAACQSAVCRMLRDLPTSYVVLTVVDGALQHMDTVPSDRQTDRHDTDRDYVQGLMTKAKDIA